MSRKRGYITRQAQRLSDGEINRRRFVMSALSAGVTMPTALSLASKAQAGTPKSGGCMRIAAGSEETFSQLLTFACCNALTEIDANGQVVGELAEHFETTDFREWVFQLTPHVTFQDGDALTADKVVSSLSRARLPGVETMHTPDRHVVRITLSRPDPEFARLLASPRFAIRNAAVVGTGAYHIDQQMGHAIRLTRRPDHWKPGRAHADAVELTLLPDLNDRVHALLAGDVDYADQIDPRAIALLQRAPSIRVMETRGTRSLALAAKDPTLVQRVAAHLPREGMVEQLLLGHGTAAPAVEGPVLAANPSAPLRFAVQDTGVPRVMEAARMIAGTLTEAGETVTFVPPSKAEDDAIHITWQREPAMAQDQRARVTALWANDLSAHQTTLGHEEQVGQALENDNARLIERWWVT